MRTKRLFAVLLLAVILAGCATISSASNQKTALTLMTWYVDALTQHEAAVKVHPLTLGQIKILNQEATILKTAYPLIKAYADTVQAGRMPTTDALAAIQAIEAQYAALIGGAK